MKKLLALVLSLVMLCSVFAVASAENGEKITIRVTWWGEVSENDAEMMMIEKFNAEHDDIKIVPEAVSYTHLDVYKRQGYACSTWAASPGASPPGSWGPRPSASWT